MAAVGVWRLLPLTGGLAVAACGGETKLDDLDAPVMWWGKSNGLCSVTVAVDAHRDVWQEQGCETEIDFKKTSKVSPAVSQELSARFDALPAMEVTFSDCRGQFHSFGRRRESRTTWSACGVSSESDVLAGLPEPFLGLAQLLWSARSAK